MSNKLLPYHTCIPTCHGISLLKINVTGVKYADTTCITDIINSISIILLLCQ